jgi:hypothetical protein
VRRNEGAPLANGAIRPLQISQRSDRGSAPAYDAWTRAISARNHKHGALVICDFQENAEAFAEMSLALPTADIPRVRTSTRRTGNGTD